MFFEFRADCLPRKACEGKHPPIQPPFPPPSLLRAVELPLRRERRDEQGVLLHSQLGKKSLPRCATRVHMSRLRLKSLIGAGAPAPLPDSRYPAFSSLLTKQPRVDNLCGKLLRLQHVSRPRYPTSRQNGSLSSDCEPRRHSPTSLSLWLRLRRSEGGHYPRLTAPRSVRADCSRFPSLIASLLFLGADGKTCSLLPGRTLRMSRNWRMCHIRLKALCIIRGGMFRIIIRCG